MLVLRMWNEKWGWFQSLHDLNYSDSNLAFLGEGYVFIRMWMSIIEWIIGIFLLFGVWESIVAFQLGIIYSLYSSGHLEYSSSF